MSDNSIRAGLIDVGVLEKENALLRTQLATAKQDIEFMLDDWDNRVYVYSENMGEMEEIRKRWGLEEDTDV